MTNGDRIRQMSNEELARLIESNPCDWCIYERGDNGCIPHPCRQGIKAYLDMEVEE